jgi:hypothetical protein
MMSPVLSEDAMNIPNENVRDRIFIAADEIYAASQRTSFPTVDAVRKKAKVNMNDASAGMKEWRRVQSASASFVLPSLPSDLQAHGLSVLTKFWDEANKYATESLLAAQNGWETERHEAEELGRQMAVAYDLQSVQLANALQEVSRLTGENHGLNEEMKHFREELLSNRDELDATRRSLNEAVVAAAEANKRADGLHQAAEYARGDAIRARGEIDALRQTHADQVERLRHDLKQELESERTRMERERQRYEAQAIKASTEAAHLLGKLEAITGTTGPTANLHVQQEKSAKSNGGTAKSE